MEFLRGKCSIGTVPADMATRTPSIFGANLRRLRLSKGLSQQALADKLGVSRPYIAQLENGSIQEPGTGTVQRIADALEVSASALLSPGHATPIAPLLATFRDTPYFQALKPTDEEMEWLASIDAAWWLTVPPSHEAIVALIKAKRGIL